MKTNNVSATAVLILEQHSTLVKKIGKFVRIFLPSQRRKAVLMKILTRIKVLCVLADNLWLSLELTKKMINFDSATLMQ